jgi:hypothetical protein
MVVADSQPGHIDQIKQTNAGAVYRLIDQLGPVSRIDLSRFAQLAPASITKSCVKCSKRIWFRRRKSRSRGAAGVPPWADGRDRGLALSLRANQPR